MSSPCEAFLEVFPRIFLACLEPHAPIALSNIYKNPSWRSVSTNFFKAQDVTRETVFLVCVWSCHKKPFVVEMQRLANLAELCYVGNSLLSADFPYPQNTVIFELSDGFYVTDQLRDQLV
jgi:hypothetical protein